MNDHVLASGPSADYLAAVRALALPAQSLGGGIGRGAEPPSEV